jgi:drug/metabolite transporter (DMT)-like permease
MSASRPDRLSMSTTDWLLLFLLSLLWGGVYFFGKIAVVEIPPLTLALGRVAIAAAVLAVFVFVGSPSSSLQPLSSYIVLGFLQNVIPFGLIFWGQIHIPSSLSSILLATTPLFTVLIAHIATADDKLTLARLIGLVAGFFGVAIVIGSDLLHEFGTNLAAEVASPARRPFFCHCRCLWPPLPQRAVTRGLDRAIDCLNDHPRAYGCID